MDCYSHPWHSALHQNAGAAIDRRSKRRARWDSIIKTLLGWGDARRHSCGKSSARLVCLQCVQRKIYWQQQRGSVRWQGTVHHHVHLCTRTAPNCPSVTQHAHPPACLLMRNNCMDEGGKSSVIKWDSPKSASSLTATQGSQLKTAEWIISRSWEGCVCFFIISYLTFICSVTILLYKIDLTPSSCF